MTRQEWNELARHLSVAYRSQKFLVEKAELDIWYGYLKTFSYERVKECAKEWVYSSPYAPRLADFADKIRRKQTQAKDYNMRIKAIYYEMESYYPVSLRDKDRFEAFKKALRTSSPAEAVMSANAIKMDVISVVKAVENGEREELPTLSECIRECTQDVKQ